VKKPFLSPTSVVLALLAALGGLAWASHAAAGAPSLTSIFQVEGMTCGGCEAGVKLAVKRLDGVVSVEASYEEKRATVVYDGTKVTPQAILKAIEKLGYSARLVETKKASGTRSSGRFAALHSCC